MAKLRTAAKESGHDNVTDRTPCRRYPSTMSMVASTDPVSTTMMSSMPRPTTVSRQRATQRSSSRAGMTTLTRLFTTTPLPRDGPVCAYREGRR
jgi:hypothetical protein